MSDNALPTNEFIGPTEATDKIFKWQDYKTTTTLDDISAALGINCPFEIHVVEPCKNRKGKVMVLVAETGYWRGWLAQKLLNLSFWLGKFTYESIEDLEE